MAGLVAVAAGSALVVTACSSATTQAYRIARAALDVDTVGVLDCLNGVVGKVGSPTDRPRVLRGISPCVWEGVVDTPDSSVDAAAMSFPDWPETLASLALDGDRATVHVLVVSLGGGQVGVDSAQVEMATCFTATLDLTARAVVDVGPTACRASIVDGRQIEKMIPFDEIDLTVSTEVLHPGN